MLAKPIHYIQFDSLPGNSDIACESSYVTPYSLLGKFGRFSAFAHPNSEARRNYNYSHKKASKGVGDSRAPGFLLRA
jgi:hypothetical protein